jgi:ABC-type Zn uptake system ZnuABC Zn-binding protein ZnuA
MHMKLLLLLPLAILTPLLAACGGSDGDPEKPNVVAITTQIGDFAKNVGGDRIDLTVLLKPNQDAHDFDFEPSQLRYIAGADLILRNGLGLDDFLDDALENTDAAVVAVTDGSALRESSHDHDEEEDDEEHEGHGVDPHVWLSVDNARVMVENVRDALIDLDGNNADYYRDNATRYLSTLDALDRDIQTQVQSIPAACRKLVTNHEVLGYFADAYGFELVGSVIPSTVTDAQPSAADVADIVRKIRDEDVPAIFAESSANPALVQQVARESGIKVVDDLYGDSLGPTSSPGGTYDGMMRENTRKIVEALKAC